MLAIWKSGQSISKLFCLLLSETNGALNGPGNLSCYDFDNAAMFLGKSVSVCRVDSQNADEFAIDQ
jgi:hypothetical protein